jgi:hypothetical protein
MIHLQTYLNSFVNGFRTLSGLNREEQMEEAYNSLTKEEREQLDRMVSYSNK